MPPKHTSQKAREEERDVGWEPVWGSGGVAEGTGPPLPMAERDDSGPCPGRPGEGKTPRQEAPAGERASRPSRPSPHYSRPAVTALPQAPRARGPGEATAPPAPGCTQRPHPRRPPHARPAWSPPRAAPADFLLEPRAPSTCPRPAVDGPAVKQIRAVPPFPTPSPRSPLSYVSY